MGVSTDAVLFFGFCWDDETVLLADDEWVETLLTRRGERDPWDDCQRAEIGALPYEQRRAAEKAWTDAHRAELDAWYDKKEAAEEEFGCDIGYHCSDGCQMPYVYIKASCLSARRGRPENVKALTVEDGWPAELDRFMKALAIKKPKGQKKPGWWLVSYWG